MKLTTHQHLILRLRILVNLYCHTTICIRDDLFCTCIPPYALGTTSPLPSRLKHYIVECNVQKFYLFIFVFVLWAGLLTVPPPPFWWVRLCFCWIVTFWALCPSPCDGWWMWKICGFIIDGGNMKCLEENLAHCHFVHNKSHMYCNEIWPGSPSWTSGDWSSHLWLSPLNIGYVEVCAKYVMWPVSLDCPRGDSTVLYVVQNSVGGWRYSEIYWVICHQFQSYNLCYILLFWSKLLCFVPCVICILSENFKISKNDICTSCSGGTSNWNITISFPVLNNSLMVSLSKP